MVRWCWINFQCRGVLLIWIIVGQGPTALAGGAGGGCLDIFSLVYHFSFLTPSLWETARYRLKYCLKGPLSPNQPTNQPTLLEKAEGETKVCGQTGYRTQDPRLMSRMPYRLRYAARQYLDEGLSRMLRPCFTFSICYVTGTLLILSSVNGYEIALFIGVGRFRVLGVGQGLKYWGVGGKVGPNSQQTHDVVLTSMRRSDVTSTTFRHHVPTRFLINQCQIITFLILKSDNIDNSRIELILVGWLFWA